MKKLVFISILLLLTLPSLGQVVIDTKTTITGLGELRFGMSPTEVEKTISRHKTKKTEIISKLDEDGTIIFTDVVYENTPFDVCHLTFKDNRLKEIALIDYFDESFEASSIADQFINVRSKYEEKYGIQTGIAKMKDNAMFYGWYDNNLTFLLVSLLLNNKTGEKTIIVSAKMRENAIEQEKKESTPGVLIPEFVTPVAITGFGDFALGMSPRKMETVLDQYVTPATKISGIFDGESSISAKKISLLGYTFDQCFFTFIDNQLSNISLSMYFDKKTRDPKEFEELLSMLENDYGKRPKSDNNIYIWQNKDNRLIMLSKRQEKKRTEISLSISVNLLDTRNLEVYK